ncbi:hypothetical protein cce_0356 [Crocosphaera subtropica ATCC 51142]|uniref:Uncharacterized protein n=1 Tax=Crocosphaera subtropica (strain ATCC 51142 / BH68) TaxID=43989 RepID=B1X166_CROS5|nr:hypothetical protein [Crocosphaera subtropica]ACB49707.1 hypothetical protein cce_0356 [Crocosphaera subtropica ATCC 51142]
MAKKNKLSQFPRGKKTVSANTNVTATPPKYNANNTKSELKISQATITNSKKVQPEQMSLFAHAAIQVYIEKKGEKSLDKEDLNAVLRLSQHLRIFGLLSAVGYINQTNEQEGKVRKRTVPVWHCLLGYLIAPSENLDTKDLMEKVINLTKNEPQQYMSMWRKSLLLAPHWNFWARAYSKD